MNTEKPVYKTHLRPGMLVEKNDKRIKFRGKLDQLQAVIISMQCRFQADKKDVLVSVLDDIIELLRQIMRCHVLEERLQKKDIMGIRLDEYRTLSHKITGKMGKTLPMPSYKLGSSAAELNCLRTYVRETELYVYDIDGYDHDPSQMDIAWALNRLSSAVFVIYVCEVFSALDGKTKY